MRSPWAIARRLAGVLAAAVALGVLAAPAGAAPRHVTVVLRPTHPAALSGYVRAVSDPASPLYRRYLTPAQFATRFGAAPAALERARGLLRAAGYVPQAVSANHLAIAATPAHASAHLAHPARLLAATRLPDPTIAGVEGTRAAPGPHPLLVRAARPGVAHAPRAPHVATGGPRPCAAAASAAAASGGHTADQIASAYGLSPVYGHGDLGAGVTVALYELEPVAAADLAAYQHCYGTHTSIGYVKVDGGPGTGEGSGEAALDIENLLGYAPQAHLLVYEGPNSQSSAPGAGPYDVLSAIVNQDRAQVASISWGECEPSLGRGDAQLENVLLQQAAVQGQTIVAAAGDSGSEDCELSGSVPSPQPAVDDPGSQPLVVSVGGTTLDALGPRPAEQVWNSGSASLSASASGAGGGGVSAFWPMPLAQLNADRSLGVRSGAPNGASCGRPGAWCREAPDVAADADPATGYEVYYNGAGGDPNSPRGWQEIGGTSAAAPVWSAVIALADASGPCQRGTLGMALPALYRAAGAGFGTDFNDVRAGNNDYTGTNSGRYAAVAGYDMASGLGSPNASALIPALCGAALRILPVSAPRSVRLAALAGLPIRVRDMAGARTAVTVRGLPNGLRYRPALGVVSGRPRRLGRFHVTVAATDADGSRAGVRFVWTIVNRTSLLDAVLHGAGSHPTLSFTVATGRGAPGVARLVIDVPGALALHGTRSVGMRSGGHRVRFAAALHAGHLELTLRRATGRVAVTLGPDAIASARHGRGRTLHVSVTGADGATLDLRAPVSVR